MITSIVFDVDDTIYDQQAPYRIAMEKCFPDFDMTHMNQAYIRFRHYSDIGFPRVMTGEWTTEYFRFWRCKETLLEFGYHEIDEEMGNHFQEVYVRRKRQADSRTQGAGADRRAPHRRKPARQRRSAHAPAAPAGFPRLRTECSGSGQC